MAATTSLYVAFVWPIEATILFSFKYFTNSRAPGSSTAKVTILILLPLTS